MVKLKVEQIDKDEEEAVIVDGASFLYTQKDVYNAKEKLYEFESISARSALFRCSKSMILNADKIDYIRPSVSGRFEAVLSNGEIVIISRKYVVELKKMMGLYMHPLSWLEKSYGT